MVKREVRWSEKRKFARWATEGTLEKTKAWYKKDNCFSRSEFIEKAIDFYVGYLSSEENESYLPNIVISTLKAVSVVVWASVTPTRTCWASFTRFRIVQENV